jgi:shikimate kinase
MLSPKLEFDNGRSAGSCVFSDTHNNTYGVLVRYHLRKTIAVIGLMGAGKTAVGMLVAQKLGTRFLDSDQEIEKAANMSVAEIFDRDGEVFFRAKESQVLERLLKGAPCVLSTGGGAYMSARNRELISQHGVALWLRADVDLLWSRVRHKNTRPLLRTENPRQTLTDLHTGRTPIYSLAEIVVDSEHDISLEGMADKVVQMLLDHPASGVTQGVL